MGPILETLRDRGAAVFTYAWNHGTPAVGEHTDVVYQYRGRYYASFSYDGRLEGPFGSLEEVLTEADGLLGVGAATTAIWSSKLAREDLIRRLVVYDGAEGLVIEVNNSPWRVPQKRLTIRAVRTRLERWWSARTETSQRQASSWATFMGLQGAAKDVRELEATLTRLKRAPTWQNVVRELTGLRLSTIALEAERRELLLEIERDRRRLPGRRTVG